MGIDFNTFKGLIQQKKIENIYQFFGPEAGEKDDAYQLIKKKFSEGSEINELTFYGSSDIDSSILLENLQTGSLFSEKKIIHIKDFNLIKAKTEKLLESVLIPGRLGGKTFQNILGQIKDISSREIMESGYTESTDDGAYYLSDKKKGPGKKKIYDILKPLGYVGPADDTLLIVSSDELDYGSVLGKYISNNQTVIFWELFDNQKTTWTKDEFKKNGLIADDDAVNMILELVENNKQQLRYEIEKISSFIKEQSDGNRVSASFMEDFFAHTKEESTFSLFKAIMEKNLSKALDILHVLLYSDERTIISGLSWSHRRFLMFLDQIINYKKSISVVFQFMNIRSKKQQVELEAGLKNYTFEHISFMTRYLSELEYYAKVLPEDLALIKYEQFLITYINGKKHSGAISGNILYSSNG